MWFVVSVSSGVVRADHVDRVVWVVVIRVAGVFVVARDVSCVRVVDVANVVSLALVINAVRVVLAVRADCC